MDKTDWRRRCAITAAKSVQLFTNPFIKQRSLTLDNHQSPTTTIVKQLRSVSTLSAR